MPTPQPADVQGDDWVCQDSQTNALQPSATCHAATNYYPSMTLKNCIKDPEIQSSIYLIVAMVPALIIIIKIICSYHTKIHERMWLPGILYTPNTSDGKHRMKDDIVGGVSFGNLGPLNLLTNNGEDLKKSWVQNFFYNANFFSLRCGEERLSSKFVPYWYTYDWQVIFPENEESVSEFSWAKVLRYIELHNVLLEFWNYGSKDGFEIKYRGLIFSLDLVGDLFASLAWSEIFMDQLQTQTWVL